MALLSIVTALQSAMHTRRKPEYIIEQVIVSDLYLFPFVDNHLLATETTFESIILKQTTVPIYAGVEQTLTLNTSFVSMEVRPVLITLDTYDDSRVEHSIQFTDLSVKTVVIEADFTDNDRLIHTIEFTGISLDVVVVSTDSEDSRLQFSTTFTDITLETI